MNSKECIEFAVEVIERELTEIQKLKTRIDLQFYHIINKIISSQGKVIVVGVGKNAPIANKMVATLNSTGTVAQFLHAGEAVHGDLGLVNKDDVALILSKSGNTAEIKTMLPSLKKLCSATVAITGNLQSFLAKNTDYVLDTTVSREAGPQAVAPTSSTTVQLVMCDALAMSLKKWKKFGKEDFGVYHPGGSLGKMIAWKVADIVDTEYKPAVKTSANIKEVIQSLSSGRFGITAVMEDDKIVGVITDGDLRRMLEKYDRFDGITAKDIATFSPKTIKKDELAFTALKMINRHKIGQLIVVDNDDKYYGIIDFHILTKEGFSEE